MEHSAQWTRIDAQREKFVHTWSPTSEARAHVCIVHGLGEHGGRYHRLAADFVTAGLKVFAFDQQGHGQNPGKRGCIQSYASLMDDIEAMLAFTQQGLPLVLLGHSMGGNLVLNYALRKTQLPIAVISSSPMIKAARPPGRFMEVLLRMLMRVAPNVRLHSKVVASRLMSNRTEQKELEQDDLFHSDLSLRLGGALLDSGRWLLENAPRLSVPTLLTHGTNDYLTCPDASRQFAAAAGPVCQLEILHGQLHDPFRDEQRERVITKFISFIRDASEAAKPEVVAS